MSDIDKLIATGTVETVADLLNPRAVIGSNNPPPTPLEAHTTDIEDLYAEASAWLTGVPITSQEQADGVTELMDKADKAGKAADAQRVVEKKPHDDAAAAVQKAYKPLVDKAARIKTGTKAALTAWMIAEQTRLRAIADAERKAAEDAADAARALHLEAAATGDLAALEDAEIALKDAKQADKLADRADKAKPMAKVEGMARGVGLRTVWTPTISDRLLAMRSMWKHDAAAFDDLLLQMAKDRIRGGAREIDGFTITQEQKL